MTAPAHPILTIDVVAQRHAEFRAEADRDRRVHRAMLRAPAFHRWFDLATAMAVVVLRVLLLAVGSTVPVGSSPRDGPILAPAPGQTDAPVPETRFPHPGVMRQVSTAGLYERTSKTQLKSG